MAPNSSKSPGSVIDGLNQVFQDIASLKLAQDAVGPAAQIIDKLSQATLQARQILMQQKAQQAAQQQMQAAQGAAQGQPPGGAPGQPQPGQPPQGGAPGAAMGGPSQAGPPPGMIGPQGGQTPGMQMPNADELRRVLADRASDS